MHESLFSNSAFAEGATVLRLALKPFSIGHEILLWKANNPLVTIGEESFKELPEDVQRSKLFVAAQICERTWRQNHSPFKWPRLTAYFRRDCKIEEEIKKFREYRWLGSMDFPMVKMPRVQGHPYHYFGAPDESRLILFVNRERLHETFGYETPFDFPIALAKQLYSAQAEAEGSLWIQNFQDVENQKRLEAFEKENPGSTLAVGEEAVQKSAEKWNREHPDCPVILPKSKTSGEKN